MNKKIRSILLSTGLALGLTLSFPSSAKAATYEAVKGNSLYLISQVFHTSVAALMRDTNYIYVGQVLNIPILNSLITQASSKVSSSQTTKALSTIDEAEKKEPWQNYSAAELDLLARLIMAETESQPYQAKVAVGAVVMNRIESGVFASTISDVINQKFGEYYQFTPVENGWINRPANEECIRAAKEALNGTDPTNGSLYYYDDSTTNTWILSKPVSVKIGRMVYAY